MYLVFRGDDVAVADPAGDGRDHGQRTVVLAAVLRRRLLLRRDSRGRSLFVGRGLCALPLLGLGCRPFLILLLRTISTSHCYLGVKVTNKKTELHPVFLMFHFLAWAVGQLQVNRCNSQKIVRK